MGTDFSDNGSLILDNENEVQPDACLWLDEAYGGQAAINADDYLTGGPELVVEVAASSVAYDLHEKQRSYRRAGIREYLVLAVHEQETHWFVWQEGAYERVKPNEQGVYQSPFFPGLWLDAAAFWQEDLATVLAVLQKGIASAEHQAFLDQLINT